MTSLIKRTIDLLPFHCRWVCAFVVAAVTTLVAQDPVVSLPENYKREFENEYVRVTRVLYPPYAKLRAHAHTPLATAYVYLNDSGPVAFKHIGAEYGAVTRQPTAARAFRVYRGLEEIHEVENLSDRPSEFLRVEFKTDPVDPATLRGKFLSEPGTMESFRKTQFENAQVRITRLRWRDDRDAQFETLAYPSLQVLLSESEMGQVKWTLPGQSGMPANGNASRGEALQIEFKTAPLTIR
jgi:hypothetical protein